MIYNNYMPIIFQKILNYEQYCLIESCKNDNIDQFHEYLKKIKTLKFKYHTERYETPINLIIKHNSIKIIKYLIKIINNPKLNKKYQINQSFYLQDSDNINALQACIIYNNFELFYHGLSFGVQFDLKLDKFPFKKLYSDAHIIQEFLEFLDCSELAFFTKNYTYTEPLLLIAIKYKRSKFVKFLLEKYYYNLTPEYYTLLLYYAVRIYPLEPKNSLDQDFIEINTIKIIELLIEYQADINTTFVVDHHDSREYYTLVKLAIHNKFHDLIDAYLFDLQKLYRQTQANCLTLDK